MLTKFTCQVCTLCNCMFRKFCEDDVSTPYPKEYWPNLKVEAI